MKQGRNDTCACGSGLKYKKCCFDKQVANQVHDLELRRLQDTEKRLLPRLVRYAEDVFGGAAFDAAWMELTEGAFGESFNPDDELSIAYLPWFLYSWTVSDESMRDELGLPRSCPLCQSVAAAFLESKQKQLTDIERQLLEASIDRPFAFYQVKGTEGRERVFLENLMTSEATYLEDESVARDLKAGDIILASLRMPVQNRRLPLGMFPWIVTADQLPFIEELRQDLLEEEGLVTLDDNNLIAMEPLIIGTYLDLMLDEAGVEMIEGEPYEVHFQYSGPIRETVAKLLSLDPETSEEEAYADAEFHEDGTLQTIEILWLEPGREDGDVWGIVCVEEGHIVGFTRTEEKAQQLKLELQKRLQGIASFDYLRFVSEPGTAPPR
jgi:hypothetical protein